MMNKVWQDISNSECRLSMMVELKKSDVGFGDLENFDLELNSKFRSIYYQERVKVQGSQSRVVQEAMKLKIRDEEKYLHELYEKRKKIRQDLARKYTKNSRTYRRVLKQHRIEANKTTQDFDKKYKQKVEHLRRKFRESEQDKIKKLPKGLEDFAKLRVFDQEMFDKIVAESYEILVIGDLVFDEDEKNAMKLPPKFSIVEDLVKGGLDFDQEAAFAKLRMEIQREIDEDLQEEDEAETKAEPSLGEEEEETELNMKAEEEMAKSRQVYDPLS